MVARIVVLLFLKLGAVTAVSQAQTITPGWPEGGKRNQTVDAMVVARKRINERRHYP